MDASIKRLLESRKFKSNNISGSGIICGISATQHKVERYYNCNVFDQFVISWILNGSGMLYEGGKEYKLTDMCVCLRRTGHDWLMRLDETSESSIRLYFDLPHTLYPAFTMMIPELDFIAPVRKIKYRRELLNEFLSLYDDFTRISITDFYTLLPKLVHYILNLTGILADRAATPMLKARSLLEDVSLSLPLTAVAEQCGLNYNTFRKQFTAAYGMTPGQYRINCRIEAARSALFAGESVSSVAERLGYPDVYTFTHQFTAIVGVSPAKYRSDYSS